MNSIIIKYNDTIVDLVALHHGEFKIGRRTTCDIVLDHPGVSGEHAIISVDDDICVIQDLNSTNGTFVGNKRVTRQQLELGDVVRIAGYTLRYTDMPLDFAIPPLRVSSGNEENRTVRLKQGQLFVLSGVDAGKRIDLASEVTHLGETNKLAGTITRLADGYLIQVKHDGEKLRLNGKAVPSTGAMLQNGDVLDVGNARLQFYCK